MYRLWYQQLKNWNKIVVFKWNDKVEKSGEPRKQKTTYKVSAVGRSSQWAWINEKTLPPKEMPKEMLSGIVLPHKIQSQTRSEKWKKMEKTIILAEKWRKTSPADSLRSVHKPFLCLVLWGTRCLETCFGNHVFVKPGKQILGTTCRTFNETHRLITSNSKKTISN